MKERLVFSSVTRISDLSERSLSTVRVPTADWRNGDYVVGEVVSGALARPLELCNGRTVELFEGELVVGALGRRHATLEATGTWEGVGDDGRMAILTRGGVFGRITSLSTLMSAFPEIEYRGHLLADGERSSMGLYVRGTGLEPTSAFAIPTILVLGTSMSTGKTTVVRVLVRLLRAGGLRVLGAKLTGAGHYRDILTMADAGADPVLDFVDVGLPSTVVPVEEYGPALGSLLTRMESSGADVAAVEVGASPLEPYNGEAAIQMIRDAVRFIVLCASDPYAARGFMEAYPLPVDLVTGTAANTLAGVELIGRLSGLPALDLRDRSTWPEAARMLNAKLDLELPFSAARRE